MVAAINAPGSSQTVFTYAAALLNTNLSFSQVAMATTALMFSATATTATLDNISTNFLPAQVSLANANGFNPTVYAAEATGLALAGDPAFAPFTALNVTAFSQQVATLTGVNQAAIQGFADFWIGFYTQFPAGTQGLTVTQAAYGAAFGEAIGVALLNPTSANLQTVISTTAGNAFSPNTVTGVIANALILNGENLYTAGVALGSLPQHQLLQGEAAGQQTTFTFTPQTDTFPGTSGNDTFNGLISGTGTPIGDATSTLSPLQFDSADGSGGNDTINLIVGAAGASLAAVASLVLGVEKWSINQTQGALTDGVIDVATLNSANFIEQIGPPFLDVVNVGTDDTVGFTSTTTGPVNNAIFVATGVNSAKAQLKDVGAVTLSFQENTVGDLTKVEVGGNPAANLTIDLGAAAVNTVVLGITSATNTPIAFTGATISLQTIDAQTSTGDLTLDVSALTNVKSVTLGSGDDNLTDELGNKGPVTTVTENLGAGDDTFNVGLATPAQNVAMNITLGTGSDVVVVTNGNIANIAVVPVPANLAQGLVTITDFNLAGGDVLNIAAPFDATTPQEQNAISAAATLFAAVTLAAANTNAGGDFTVFNYGANAYVFENNGNQQLDTGDGLIELVGVQTGPLIAATGTQFIHL